MKKRRTALILASSSGLGLAAARALYRSGCNIIMTSRSEKIYRAKQQIEKSSYDGEILALQGDVTDCKYLDDIIETGIGRFGSIDIVFTNVGGPKPGRFNELTIEEYMNAHNTLLLPVIYLTKKLIPKMQEERWGRIIINTSITAKEPSQNLILSNIYRAALVSYGKTIATQLAQYNITVNTIAPACFKTERALEIMTKMSQEKGCSIDVIEAENTKQVPMKRYNDPEEFGEVVSFLASEVASGITGSYIAVDGGITHGIF